MACGYARVCERRPIQGAARRDFCLSIAELPTPEPFSRLGTVGAGQGDPFLVISHVRHAQRGSSRAGAATSLPYMRSDAAPLTTSVVRSPASGRAGRKSVAALRVALAACARQERGDIFVRVRAQQVSGSDGGLLIHDAHRVPQQSQLVRTTVCVALHDKHTV